MPILCVLGKLVLKKVVLLKRRWFGLRDGYETMVEPPGGWSCARWLFHVDFLWEGIKTSARGFSEPLKTRGELLTDSLPLYISEIMQIYSSIDSTFCVHVCHSGGRYGLDLPHLLSDIKRESHLVLFKDWQLNDFLMTGYNIQSIDELIEKTQCQISHILPCDEATASFTLDELKDRSFKIAVREGLRRCSESAESFFEGQRKSGSTGSRKKAIAARNNLYDLLAEKGLKKRKV